ncbi:Farnesol dehydrogenase [Pseudolycoriella hygida]|uniref:Farnesol dehydrogenase n=1 Tax=Pseudolycoriella hygida TaxID=35572 RepID=A0A9Q0RYE0_9DIPT|nr:Farnesol dehydrogenase [Pseudolycoriella hygida]
MERWVGKVAVVTGASAGIGAQIVLDLADAGLIVVGLARRLERVETLKSKSKGKIHALQCDVTNEADILKAFKWIIDNLGGVDVLVNNAGILRGGNLIDPGNTALIKEVLDTNVMGVVQCTREAFQSMKSRNVDGHIIIINSVAGHQVPNMPGMGSLNIYSPSKHAVTAMTEVLRQEFQKIGTRVKITSISPGGVRTEIGLASGATPEMLEAAKNMPMLDSADVSQAVIYVLKTKPHVQVHELIIKPLGELI